MAQSLTQLEFHKVRLCVRDRVESPKSAGIEGGRTWSESPARRERPNSNTCTKYSLNLISHHNLKKLDLNHLQTLK